MLTFFIACFSFFGSLDFLFFDVCLNSFLSNFPRQFAHVSKRIKVQNFIFPTSRLNSNERCRSQVFDKSETRADRLKWAAEHSEYFYHFYTEHFSYNFSDLKVLIKVKFSLRGSPGCQPAGSGPNQKFRVIIWYVLLILRTRVKIDQPITNITVHSESLSDFHFISYF